MHPNDRPNTPASKRDKSRFEVGHSTSPFFQHRPLYISTSPFFQTPALYISTSPFFLFSSLMSCGTRVLTRKRLMHPNDRPNTPASKRDKSRFEVGRSTSPFFQQPPIIYFDFTIFPNTHIIYFDFTIFLDTHTLTRKWLMHPNDRPNTTGL